MSVGPEALRRFGPLLFLACPRGQAAVRARGARLLCVPVGPGCCARPTGVPDCCVCPTGVPGAGEPGRPRDLASSLRSAPRLEARPGPPGPPAPSTPVEFVLSVRIPSRPRRRPPAPQPGPPIPPAPSTPVGLWWLTLLGASSLSPARPCRRPPAPQPGPPIPPAPSTPVWFVVTVRIPSRPRRRPQAPQPGPPIPPAPSTPVGLWWLTLLGASSRSPSRPHRRPRAPQPGPPIPPAPSTPVGLWWDFTELGAGCRRAGVLMMQHSHLVAVKPRREAVWRSKCRPPR